MASSLARRFLAESASSSSTVAACSRLAEQADVPPRLLIHLAAF
jgi:hypothetical protein